MGFDLEHFVESSGLLWRQPPPGNQLGRLDVCWCQRMLIGDGG